MGFAAVEKDGARDDIMEDTGRDSLSVEDIVFMSVAVCGFMVGMFKEEVFFAKN